MLVHGLNYNLFINKSTVVARDWGGGCTEKGGVLFNKYKVSYLQGEKFWRLLYNNVNKLNTAALHA